MRLQIWKKNTKYYFKSMLENAHFSLKVTLIDCKHNFKILCDPYSQTQENKMRLRRETV